MKWLFFKNVNRKRNSVIIGKRTSIRTNKVILVDDNIITLDELDKYLEILCNSLFQNKANVLIVRHQKVNLR